MQTPVQINMRGLRSYYGRFIYKHILENTVIFRPVKESHHNYYCIIASLICGMIFTSELATYRMQCKYNTDYIQLLFQDNVAMFI